MAVPDIGSIDYVKYTNVTRCFQIILKAAETSRTRIAEISRISKVTVSSCVDFLLDKKLICEVGFQESRRGRKPTLITVNPNAGILLGIEADVVCSKYIVTDFAGKLLEQGPIPCEVDNPETFMAQVQKLVLRICEDYPGYEHGLIGVGIALSGYYDERSGLVSYVANRASWNGYPLKANFQKIFPDIPLIVNRLANAGAICEGFLDTSLLNNDSIAFLHCSWGLGVGIYQNRPGKPGLINGSSRFGHTTINYNGRLCSCGNRGCLESYASLRALYRKIFPERSISSHCIDDLTACFDQKDPALLTALDEIVLYLSIGLSNVVNAYQPRKIYIGGLIQLFLTEENLTQIRRSVEATVPDVFRQDLQIELPAHGIYSALYGCIGDVRNRILQFVF